MASFRPPDAEHFLEIALSNLLRAARRTTGDITVKLPDKWDVALSLMDRNTRVYSHSTPGASVEESSLYKNRYLE